MLNAPVRHPVLRAPQNPQNAALGPANLASSRVSRLAGVPPDKAFARLSSLLMRRGYGPEIARSAALKALEIPFGE